MTIFALGCKGGHKFTLGGGAPPSVNLGHPHIPETIGASKLKFTHILLRSSALYGNEYFSARGRAWDAAPLL